MKCDSSQRPGEKKRTKTSRICTEIFTRTLNRADKRFILLTPGKPLDSLGLKNIISLKVPLYATLKAPNFVTEVSNNTFTSI